MNTVKTGRYASTRQTTSIDNLFSQFPRTMGRLELRADKLLTHTVTRQKTFRRRRPKDAAFPKVITRTRRAADERMWLLGNRVVIGHPKMIDALRRVRERL